MRGDDRLAPGDTSSPRFWRITPDGAKRLSCEESARLDTALTVKRQAEAHARKLARQRGTDHYVRGLRKIRDAQAAESTRNRRVVLLSRGSQVRVLPGALGELEHLRVSA